jgi:DNA repair protein RecO (recombination protein O)
MEERTSGLILRIRPLTETSLIVHWLSPDLGRIATVAKGARRPKSPFRGKLDLFYFADFSFQRSRRSELHNLREVVLRETNEALRKEITYLQQASYCAALIEQTTETETPLAAIFELMKTLLNALPLASPQLQTVFAFETKLLTELGLNPNLAKTKLSAGAIQILQKFVELDWTKLSRLKLSEAQTEEIRRFLHGFLIFHLGKIPKGRVFQN